MSTMLQESGEHVVMAAGEMHLERCLKDLRELFAKVEIEVSPPPAPRKRGVRAQAARRG